MYIETPRLIIRDFGIRDASDLQEILGDAETMRYSEPPYSLEKTTGFLQSFCIDRHAAVAAVHRESGKLIGYILFHETDAGIYELGWFFNRAYWRRGYAYESCKAVIDYGFGRLHAHKIFAETIDAGRSVPLMQKLGMQLEEIQRRQIRDSLGNWADLYLYAILAKDKEGDTYAQ